MQKTSLDYKIDVAGDGNSSTGSSKDANKTQKMMDWLLMRNVKPPPQSQLNYSGSFLKQGFPASDSNSFLQQSMARESFARFILDPNNFIELRAFDLNYARLFDFYDQYMQLEGSIEPKIKTGFGFKSKKSEKLPYPLHIYRFFLAGRMDISLYGMKGDIPVIEVPANLISTCLVFHETFLSANAPALHTVSEQIRRYVADQLVFGAGSNLNFNVFDPAIDQVVYTIYREVYHPYLHGKISPQTPKTDTGSLAFSAPVNSRVGSPSIDSLSSRPSTTAEELERASSTKNKANVPAVPNAYVGIYSAEQFDPEIAHNRESFVRVLDDVYLYGEFQRYCEADFCLENFLFIESFTKLEQMLCESVTKYGSTHKSRARFQSSEKYTGALKSALIRRFLGMDPPSTEPLPRDSATSSPMLKTSPANTSGLPCPNRNPGVSSSQQISPVSSNSTTQQTPISRQPTLNSTTSTTTANNSNIAGSPSLAATSLASLNDSHPQGYVPVWLVSHFLGFYDSFLPAGSEHEVNIPGLVRKRITDTLISGGAYKIPTTVFDEAADEVMRMLYLNTYARFVKMKVEQGQHNVNVGV